MTKKKYSHGKGYRRRQLEAQRKEAAKQYKRKEGPRMVKDYTQEILAEAYQEAELVTWQRKAEQYKAAWEAEKKIANANMAGLRTAREKIEEMRHRALLLALLGVFIGLILGLTIGELLL